MSANTAAALNNPAWPIRAYITAVGNDADEHYFGAYADSGVDGTSIPGITTPGHLHLFQRTDDTTDVLGLGAQPLQRHHAAAERRGRDLPDLGRSVRRLRQ